MYRAESGCSKRHPQWGRGSESWKSRNVRCLVPVSRVGLLVTYELGGIVSFLLQKINAVERMGEDKQKETISRLSIKTAQA